MGHFAKVNDGRVTQVIIVEKYVIDSWNADIIKHKKESTRAWWDPLGIFTGKSKTPFVFGIDSTDGEWVEGDIHARGGKYYEVDTGQVIEDKVPFRKNFPGIGFFYDEVHDAFYAPQPFPSWTLNKETFIWDPPPPIPIGDDWPWGADWNEELYQLDNTKGWVSREPSPCEECIPNPEDL